MTAKAAKITATRFSTGIGRPAPLGLPLQFTAFARLAFAFAPALNVGLAEIQRQAKAS